jgi:hypothetical protein
VGSQVVANRSGTVEKALSSLIAASSDATVGPELTSAGFIESDVTKVNGYLTRIHALDVTQERAKGARPSTGNKLRLLQLKIQDSVNGILGKSNIIYADDDDSLRLFTNCLPRSAGGTGEEVGTDEAPADTTSEPTTSETPE